MTTLAISRQEFKNAIKESVREALAEELVQIRAALIPFVSESEQKDIERRYKEPARRTVKSTMLRV